MKRLVAGWLAIVLVAAWAGFGAGGDKEEKPSPEQIAAAKKTIPELIEDLKAAKDEVRLAAVQVLAEKGPNAKDAVPGLVAAMHSLNEDLRLNAAVALAAIGKDALPALTKALESKENEVRFYAAWALHQLGPEAKTAAAALVRALSDPDEDVRRKAAAALGRIGNPEDAVSAALVKLLADHDADVRQAAGEALGQLGKSALPALREALDDPKTALPAALGLSKLGAKAGPALPAMCRLYRQLDVASAQHHPLATAIAELSAKALPDVERLFKEATPDIRTLLVTTLLDAGPKAVPLLLNAAKDPNRQVRAAAVAALADPRWIDRFIHEALVTALGDRDWFVRYSAFTGLGNRGEDVAKLIAKELKRAKGPERLNLLGVLAEHAKDDKALAALRPELKNPKFAWRYRAAGVLAWPLKGSPETIALLHDGLEQGDEDVQADAALILSWFDVPLIDSAVPALIGALETPDFQVRREVMQTLSRVLAYQEKAGDGKEVKKVDIQAHIKLALPALTRVLKDDDPIIRRTAIQTLIACGKVAAPALVQALQDTDRVNRIHVIQALGKLKAEAKDAVPALLKLAKDGPDYPLMLLTVRDIDGGASFPQALEVMQGRVAEMRDALAAAKPATSKPIDVAKALLANVHGDEAKARVRAIRAIAVVLDLATPNDLETLRALADKAMQKIVPAAIQTFKKGDTAARRDVIRLLTHAHRLVVDTNLAKQITEVLEAARTDPDAEVRYQARRPLRARDEG